jgi:putative inorganic carbon (hco3(-)) transporter
VRPERLDPIWSVAALMTGALLVAGVSLLAGAGLIDISSRYDQAAPVIVLVLVLLPIAAVATIASPRLAIAAVFLAFLAGTSATKGAIALFGVLVVLSRVAVGRTPLSWSPALWWAAAFCSWSLISLGSAVDTGLATKEVGLVFTGVLFACVVLSACRTMTDVRWVGSVIVLTAVIMVVQALANFNQLQPTLHRTEVVGRLTGAFGSPNQLGSFCAMTSFVAIGLALGGRTRLGRWSATIGLAVLLTGLTFSLSRGAWIGTILGLLFLLVAVREARRVAVVLGLPLVVIAWAVGSFAPGNTQIRVITQRVGALTFSSPYDERPAIWAEAFREIREQPWTGEGPGDFPVSSLRAGSETSSVYALHAHNIWLNVGAETGLPAVLMVFGLMAALALAGHRAAAGASARGDPRDRALVGGLCASLVSVVGQGFVDYTLRNVVCFITLWGIIGLLLVCRRELITPRSSRAGESRSDD